MQVNKIAGLLVPFFLLGGFSFAQGEPVPSWKPYEGGTAEAWASYVAGDYNKARPVFEKLANLGHPVGEFLLANLYYYGQGVPMDRKLARSWMERSAKQGYQRAFAPLAEMMAQGEGGAIDMVAAYAWYNIAIADMPEGKSRTQMMQRRDKMGEGMSTAQLSEAQKRSQLFKPAPVTPPDPAETAP